MESKIEILIKESLSLVENKFKEDFIVKQFEKSKDEFKELVIKGLANERGNQLLSISDEKSISRILFNVGK